MENGNRALFVIDMQEEYVGSKSRYRYNSAELIRKINDRIREAQKNHDIIIYVKNKRVLKDRVHIPEFVQGLDIVSTQTFYKEKSSLFSNNDVNMYLKENRVSEIETIGVDGNCCVASSAIDAVRAGFTAIFPCEYIGVLNKDRFLKKKQQLKEAGVEVIEKEEKS